VANRLKPFLLLLALAFFIASQAQTTQHVAPIKHKKCKLWGKWLLVGTVTENKAHAIDSSEYKGLIRYQCFHRYTEEAFYESMHWIIKGKWAVSKKSNTIAITARHYILGKLEDNPQNIDYTLQSLTKKSWTATSVAEQQPVSVTYNKLKRR
jgi:hypothetical protein